jgi:hypothetical protein
MLNTIEQKLSAIKAINEQKENCDRDLTALQDIKLSPEKEYFINWQGGSVAIPDESKMEIIDAVRLTIHAKREKLIIQATELMR